MSKYKPTFGIEPTDKYEKAKQDLLQALKSYDELSSDQKERLIQEIFGAKNMIMMCNMLKQYFG